MIAVVHSASLSGATGSPVTVEVHISSGLPGFTIVGLPDAAVREARDRVRAALLSTGHPWPQRRVTVNLAPSGVRKAGACLDLAIAVGVLAATELVPHAALHDVAFVGELGLDGSLRHVPGTIALADAVTTGVLVVPADDVAEAAAVRPRGTAGVATLGSLVARLRTADPWRDVGDGSGGPRGAAGAAAPPECPERPGPRELAALYGDLAEVRGQAVGRRAVEIAAAGGHHVLLVGPPGSGKTMLSRRLVGLLPPLGRDQALEVSRIHSAAGLEVPPGGLTWWPPLRAPHHGASAVSLVGGGSWWMRPGEISLATHGVLFLDEMGEFPASVLDALRQPLEEGVVRVSRARGTVTLPARFLLVAAMNPCPCGEGGPPGACRCSPAARARYARRLSGPLLDRFDLVVPLQRPEPDELLRREPGEPTAAVAERVAAARTIASARDVTCNAEVPSAQLDDVAPLSPGAASLLDHHVRAGSLSARGLDRVRRVARTVADLDGVPGPVEDRHVAEALALRAGREALAVGG